MYVTKRSMAGAVSNLTKHLEQVSEALSVSAVSLMISFFLGGVGWGLMRKDYIVLQLSWKCTNSFQKK